MILKYYFYIFDFFLYALQYLHKAIESENRGFEETLHYHIVILMMHWVQVYVKLCMFSFPCIHERVQSEVKTHAGFVHDVFVFLCTSIYLTPDIAVSLV